MSRKEGCIDFPEVGILFYLSTKFEMGNRHAKQPEAQPPRRKTMKVVLQGPLGSGKTSIQHRLNHGEFIETYWYGNDFEIVDINGIRVQAWDHAGGRSRGRFFPRYYYRGLHTLIFVIDSHDREGIDDAISTCMLKRILNEEEIIGRKVVVLANKQDITGALTAEELTGKLDEINRNRESELQLPVFPASAKTGEGFTEVCKWLFSQMSRDIENEEKSQKFEKMGKSEKLVEGCIDKIMKKMKRFLTKTGRILSRKSIDMFNLHLCLVCARAPVRWLLLLQLTVLSLSSIVV